VIEIHTDSIRESASARQTVQGIIVFDSNFAPYPHGAGPTSTKAPDIVGRQFVDLALLTREEPNRGGHDVYYSTDPRQASLEEVHATLGQDGRVVISFAPNVADYEPVFSGTLDGNTVSGTWRLSGAYEAVSAQGYFTMTRAPRTAASDSAAERVRRDRVSWKSPRKP
jgi:hypothetical protein